MRQRASQLFQLVQDEITNTLERVDGKAGFVEDLWEREGGGGGRTRILTDGSVFERAGVNFSEVHGTLSPEFAKELPGDGLDFYATGVSLVLHPWSPRIPSVHANYRYIEHGDSWWFGGGADLTPYHPHEADARTFHLRLKALCDAHDEEHYPRFKETCDQYFYLPHRNEMRGVGGIFFDNLAGKKGASFALVKDLAEGFLSCYLPIVARRCGETWTHEERNFQLLRRGRYAEFNLLYDRGTKFGLKTQGRIESIFMSMPPTACWSYDVSYHEDSDFGRVLAMLQPRDWVAP